MFYGAFLGLLTGLLFTFLQGLGLLDIFDRVGLIILYRIRGQPAHQTLSVVRRPGSPEGESSQEGSLPHFQAENILAVEAAIHESIRVIGIDQNTDRGNHADLIEALRVAGAKVVAFDVIFTKEDKPSDPVAEIREAGAGDDVAEQVEEQLRSGAPTPDLLKVLRASGVEDELVEVVRAAREQGFSYKTFRLVQAMETAGNVFLPVFQSFRPTVPVTVRRGKGSWPFSQVFGLERNDPAVAREALGIGHINVKEHEGIVVAMPVGFTDPEVKGGRILHLGLLAGIAFKEGGGAYGSDFAQEIGERLDSSGWLDSRGKFYPRLVSPPVIPIPQFLSWSRENPDEVRAFFRGTLVFVGQTALGLRNTDEVSSPYGDSFGLFYHVSTAYSVLEDDFWRPDFENKAFVVVTVCVSILLGLAASTLRAWPSLFIGGGVLFGYLGLCVVMAFGLVTRPSLWPTACFTLTVSANLLGVFVFRSGITEKLLRRREKEIEVLQADGAEGSERIDVRRVDRQIAGTVLGDELEGDWCVIRQKIKGIDEVEFSAERYGECEAEPIRKLESELSERVFTTGESLLIASVPKQFPGCPSSLCPSAMAVPLRDGEEIVGTVVLGGKLRERFRGDTRYKPEDLHFLRALAREWSDRFVIAQYNRTLEDRVQKRTLDLQMANERLGELDRQKSDFMNMVAHDLRTPLTSIRSYAEIMLTYTDEPPETYHEFLGIINDESVRLNSLIDNFLDLARIEAGSFQLDLAATDLGKLIHHAVAVFQGHAEPKGIALQAEIAPDLPRALCDGDRIAQVLANLLSNALKFTPEGGAVTIQAAAEEPQEPTGDQMLMVSVLDTGPGIPEDMQERVFEKFGQVDTDDEKVKKTQSAGTGLGLPLCREFVEKHQGRIWVESVVGQGSHFHFTVPSEGHPIDSGDPGEGAATPRPMADEGGAR